MNPTPRVVYRRLYSLMPWLLAAAFFVGTAVPIHAKDPCKNYKASAPSAADQMEADYTSYNVLESAWKNAVAYGNLNQSFPNEACFWEFLKKQGVTNEDWDRYPSAARRANKCWQGQADKASAGCDLWVKTRDELKQFEQTIDQTSQEPAQLKSKYSGLKKSYSESRGTLRVLWFSEDGTLIKWLDHRKNLIDQKISQAMTNKAEKKIGETASVKSAKQLGDNLQVASDKKGALDRTFDRSGTRRPEAQGSVDQEMKKLFGESSVGTGQQAGGALHAADSRYASARISQSVPPPEKKEESGFPARAAAAAGAAGVGALGAGAFLWQKSKQTARRGYEAVLDATDTPADWGARREAAKNLADAKVDQEELKKALLVTKNKTKALDDFNRLTPAQRKRFAETLGKDSWTLETHQILHEKGPWSLAMWRARGYEGWGEDY